MSRINKQLLKELVDEVLDEMTSSGAAGAYSPANAFQGPGDAKKKEKMAARSMPGGKVVGDVNVKDDTTIDEEVLPIIRKSLEEGRYRNFKNSDEMKNHAKISYGLREAKKIVREVKFLVGICERLKSECGVEKSQLWKRTLPDIAQINQELKEITKRLYRIGKK